jgi:SAM-dependent methyltransferase
VNHSIFKTIYKKKKWGSKRGWPFFSGTGSHDKFIVREFINQFNFYFKNKKIESILDVGCGDFNIGRKLCNSYDSYLAIDLVPDLIKFNKRKYKNKRVEFICMDATNDKLPNADVIILRQVLQHLPNSKIISLLDNIKNKYRYIVLTEHLPRGETWTPNLNIKESSGIRLNINSGVVIDKPPFNFAYTSKEILNKAEQYNGFITTIIYKS